GDAVFFAETVLDVVGDRVGHHQRAGEFEKRWLLDGLNVSPEVAVAVAQVAIPAASGPRLENHRKRIAVGLFVVGAELFDQRGESGFERSFDADLLSDGQREVFQNRSGYGHDCSFSFFSGSEMGFACASARSFTRLRWCRQKRSKVAVHSWRGRMASALVR